MEFVEFSLDDTQVLSASQDGTAKIWDVASGTLVRTFAGHSAAVICARFSPDNTLVATASIDNIVKLWDVATGQAIRTLTDSMSVANARASVSFSPDGAHLATAQLDNTAKIYNVHTGVLEKSLYGHVGILYSVSFSPDGQKLLTTSRDKTARIFDLLTGDTLSILRGHTGYIYVSAYSPNGKQVVTASSDGTARVWNADTAGEIRRYVKHSESIYGVSYSYDGEKILTGSSDDTVLLWGAPDDPEGSIVYVNSSSNCASPDGLSWETAFSVLQDGIDSAKYGSSLWVAAGVYVSSGAQVITMREGVGMYGGFIGNESALSDRDYEANDTIIDGEGQRRCIVGADNSVLDGFSVTRGHVSIVGSLATGGGMLNDNSSPIIRNCSFSNNHAIAILGSLQDGPNAIGGGIGLINSYPVITNCQFISNSVTGADGKESASGAAGDGGSAYGGGVGGGYPLISQCSFIGNSATGGKGGNGFQYGGWGGSAGGGGLYANNAVVERSIFNDNTALGGRGGAGVGAYIGRGGPGGDGLGAAGYFTGTVSNSIFSYNTASGGNAGSGAEYGDVGGDGLGGALFSAESIDLFHCTTTENKVIAGQSTQPAALPRGVVDAGGVYGAGIIESCILWNDTRWYASTTFKDVDELESGSVRYSCVDGVTSGYESISTNPRFVSSTDLRLQTTSPCIDLGICTAYSQYDYLGTVRPQGAQCDMGAYEYYNAVVVPDLSAQMEGEARSLILFCGLRVGSISYEYSDDVPSGCVIRQYPEAGSSVAPFSSVRLVVSDSLDGVVYVDSECVATLHNGRSWNTAYATIQEGIDAARAHSDSEIWVRSGTYTSNGAPVVRMKEGVHIYGGFSGDEQSRDIRNWTQNRTVLDGQHLDRCVIGATGCTLDGFVVTRGYASASTLPGFGGGMLNLGAAPKIYNCVFVENVATVGGGIAGVGLSDATIANCVFVGNRASYGGGVSCTNSFPLIVNCTLSKNVAEGSSGIGGGVWSDSDSFPTIMNCILWGNTATGEGSQLWSEGLVDYVNYSCVEDLPDIGGFGNISNDPLFEHPDSDYRLGCSSPCIDAAALLPEFFWDISGVHRPIGSGYDMGAYEYVPDPFTPPTGSVNINHGAASTNVPEVTLSLAWTNCGGFGVSRMRFSNDGATWSSWEPLSQSRAYVLPSGDGYKTVRVQYLDKVGNRSAAFSDFIRLDTTPPTGSIVINNNRSATNNPVVALKLGWSDGGGSGVTRMRFSDNGATWTPWSPLKASQAFVVPGGDGYKTIRVQYRDAANNTSATFRDFIRLDTTPPTGSILINGGDSSTRDRWVSLALSWADPGGAGASRMRFSIDGATWSGWEPLAATKAYQLPSAPGYYTVRVTYRDGADNISQRFSDYIRLDVPN
ncbi:MAG: PASTA domain-containing protein [Candidatus Hydrogenedentes bacterium]|nr:PASTA domain-containing protein [Candidatus Hydrogenedentota bacterium]